MDGDELGRRLTPPTSLPGWFVEYSDLSAKTPLGSRQILTLDGATGLRARGSGSSILHTGCIDRYDQGMKRLTISVPDEVSDKAQRAVAAGRAESVSGYFATLAENEPDWVLFREVVAEAVAEAGGVSEDDRAWARNALGLVVDERAAS